MHRELDTLAEAAALQVSSPAFSSSSDSNTSSDSDGNSSSSSFAASRHASAGSWLSDSSASCRFCGCIDRGLVRHCHLMLHVCTPVSVSCPAHLSGMLQAWGGYCRSAAWFLGQVRLLGAKEAPTEALPHAGPAVAASHWAYPTRQTRMLLCATHVSCRVLPQGALYGTLCLSYTQLSSSWKSGMGTVTLCSRGSGRG